MIDSPFYQGLGRYFTEEQLKKIRNAHVGIAGLGGVGSNVAFNLARCGIAHFFLIDKDIVDWSNLNRQHYLPSHVNKKKTDALSEQLLDLNPEIQIERAILAISEKNVKELLKKSSIWVEALDKPEIKAFFVNEAMSESRFLVSASGLCGIGGKPMLKRKIGNCVLIGDYESGDDTKSPYSPRVNQAAAMMADCVMEHILENSYV